MKDYQKILDKLGEEASFAQVIVLGSGQVDYDTTMTFAARGTKGDIVVKAVVSGDAVLNLSGNLIIEKSGVNAQGFLKQSILLLGSKAKAKATPKLEIKTDEVRASHSATVGQIDQDQLFYLKSRGFDDQSATEVIVRSFLAEAMESLLPADRAQKELEISKVLADVQS